MVKTKDLVALWARAAGMCCHPDCKTRLVLEDNHDPAVSVGQAAHIVARSAAGPRGDASIPAGTLHTYDNLILLCAHHHATIDRLPASHTIDILRTWKAEHESWVRSITESRRRDVPWIVIAQENEPRIDLDDARAALGPGNHPSAIAALRGMPDVAGWPAAAHWERQEVESLIESTPAGDRRFAVFSLASIPLAVHLGYVLGDRGRVALFHYDRDRQSWLWPEATTPDDLTVHWKQPRDRSGGDACLRISLSARIGLDDVKDVVKPDTDIEIAAEAPSVRWLKSPDQLDRLAVLFSETLSRIREGTRCTTIHLFYAGPAAGAVCFGRAYNPRMHPALELYEYRQRSRPRYTRVLGLE